MDTVAVFEKLDDAERAVEHVAQAGAPRCAVTMLLSGQDPIANEAELYRECILVTMPNPVEYEIEAGVAGAVIGALSGLILQSARADTFFIFGFAGFVGMIGGGMIAHLLPRVQSALPVVTRKVLGQAGFRENSSDLSLSGAWGGLFGSLAGTFAGALIVGINSIYLVLIALLVALTVGGIMGAVKGLVVNSEGGWDKLLRNGGAIVSISSNDARTANWERLLRSDGGRLLHYFA